MGSRKVLIMAWQSIIATASSALNLYSFVESRKAGRQAEASNRSQANRFVRHAVEGKLGEIEYTSPEFLVGNVNFVRDVIGRELRFQPLANRSTIENAFNKYLTRNYYYRGNTYTGSPVFRDPVEKLDSTTQPAIRRLSDNPWDLVERTGESDPNHPSNR